MPKGVFIYSKGKRDKLILAGLRDGKTNPQIAVSMGLTRATVREYVSEILTELDVATRTQAVVRAMESGLLPAPRRR